MKKLFIILSVLIVAAGCSDSGEKPKDFVSQEEFSKAKKSIRQFGESYFDSTYILMEGSVGVPNKFNPPMKITNFLGADTSKEPYKLVYWQQVHLAFPLHVDSTGVIDEALDTWTYYQLDDNFKVISFSKESIVKK